MAILAWVVKMVAALLRSAAVAPQDAAAPSATAGPRDADPAAAPAPAPAPALPGAASSRRVGSAGLALIRTFEGCARACGADRFAAYPDPASGGAPWTIGWGSTGDGIHEASVWTQAQCDARLAVDAATLARAIGALIGEVPTNANQFDALISFAYNLGIGNLAHSTLLARHRTGDFTGAAAQFERWNRAGGQVMAGLTRRRAAEAALYRGADISPG